MYTQRRFSAVPLCLEESSSQLKSLVTGEYRRYVLIFHNGLRGALQKQRPKPLTAKVILSG